VRRPRPRARVLLFDLDGTLTDSRSGIVGCMRFALERVGAACPADDVLATFIGPPLRRTFATLMATSDAERVERAVAFYRQRFAEAGIFDNRLYDGVPEMLARARAGGRTIYVATSKFQVYAERIVAHFGLARHLSGVYGAGPDGRHDDKAELLGHILEAEGISPETAVMVGDRATDIAAARANGIAAIGVAWGYGPRDELIAARPDALCGSPAELLDCLVMPRSAGRLSPGPAAPSP
jgi:phosphoglycolate phosphatase